MVLHLTGAVHTNSIRHIWDEEETPNCLFCSARDTMWHRFFECPALDEVRVRHNHIVHLYREASPAWLLCPAVPVDEDQGLANLWCHFRKPGAAQPLETAPGDEHFIYTDASAKAPSGTTLRDVGISVVRGGSLPANDLQTHFEARPDAYTTVLTEKLPGRQSVSRGELWAIHRAWQLCPTTTVYSDSQYATNIANALRVTNETIGHWAVRRNGDILTRMYLQVQAGQAGEVRKIKSQVMWYHICGNDRADQSAKFAQSCDASDFHKLMDDMQRREQETNELLFPFYVFIARQAKRMVAVMAQAKQGRATASPPLPHPGIFVSGPQYAPRWTLQPLDDEQVEACFMTATIANAVMKWISKVRWPDQPQPQDLGVSWVELFLSFKHDQQMEMPFSMASKDPRPHYKLRQQIPEAILLPQRGSDEIKVFQTVMKAMAGLLGTLILPMDERGKCYSMKRYGFRQRGHLGFLMRPAFPEAARVHQVLEDMEGSEERALIREVLHWDLPSTTMHPSDQYRDPLRSYVCFQSRFRGRA